MTGDALRRLPSSYTGLHDLGMPGSRANIDHVVVGPTGVFTVETKNYSSGVRLHRGVAGHAGRTMDHVVQQANGQAEAVGIVLDRSVRAIVCVHGGAVGVEGWFAKPIVDGVPCCSGRRLVDVITGQDPELGPDEVIRLAGLAVQRLGCSGLARTRPVRRSTAAPSRSPGLALLSIPGWENRPDWRRPARKS